MSTETSIQLFQSIMSSNNDERKNAEAKLNELKSMNFQEVLSVFVAGMQSSNSKISQLATLLLKKTLIDDEVYMQRLDDKLKNSLKELIFGFISFDKEPKFLERIADLIAKLYSKSALNEIFGFIVGWMANESPNARRFGIYMIEVLCDLGAINDDVVQNTTNEFLNIFNKGLEDSDIQVKISCLKATTQFISNLTQQNIVMKFSSLTGPIIDTLVYALKNDLEKGKLALQSINNLSEAYPKLWKDKLELLVEVCCQILQEKSFDEGVKEPTLQIILTMAGKTPAFMRKSDNFNKSFLPILFSMMLDVNCPDDVEEWNKLTEETEKESKEMYFSAVEGIERLALDLGGQYMLKATFSFIETYLASDNWKANHAGYSAIGFMAEGCKDVFKTHLPNLLKHIGSGLTHNHPRVKYSALLALGLLCEDVAPAIQRSYHQDVLPVLVKLMTSDDCIRVKTQATCTLVNFLRALFSKEDGIETEFVDMLKPYSKKLLEVITEVFEFSIKVNYFPLQEESLNALSLLASILDEEFAEFYPNIMPGLKKFLYNLQPVTIQECELKAKAIETISELCSSVASKPEQFLDDFKELAEAFGKIFSTLKEDDVQVKAVLDAFVHISTGMKDLFLPYLKELFPLFEKYLLADIDFQVEDGSLNEFRDKENNKKNNMTMKDDSILHKVAIQGKNISMKTFVLQNKIYASEVLRDICLNMGTSFSPFLSQYLQISKPLIKFMYSTKVRKYCTDSMRVSILACKTDDEMKFVIDFMLSEVLSKVCHNARTCLLKELRSDLKTLMRTFEAIKSPKVVSQELVISLYETLKLVVVSIDDFKKKVKDILKPGEEFDENDAGDLENNIEELNEINRRVMEINGNVFKIYKEDLSQVSMNYLAGLFENIWTNALQNTKNDNEIVQAMCYFQDLMEYGSLQDFNQVYPMFIKNCLAKPTQNSDIIHNTVYGFGLIGQRVDANVYPSLHDTLYNTITSVINRNNAYKDGNEESTDNAVAALARLVVYQGKVDDTWIKITQNCLSALPLKYDTEECCTTIKLLFTKYLEGHQLLTNNAAVENLKQAIIRIANFEKDKSFLDDEGKLILGKMMGN